MKMKKGAEKLESNNKKQAEARMKKWTAKEKNRSWDSITMRFIYITE